MSGKDHFIEGDFLDSHDLLENFKEIQPNLIFKIDIKKIIDKYSDLNNILTYKGPSNDLVQKIKGKEYIRILKKNSKIQKETYRNTQVMELIYFRPFNFNNPERITHSLQYTFEPVYPWHVLRSNFPETYENKIIPAPPAESWVHAKVIIGEKKVQVFVNNNALPSLEVSRLAIIIHGKFGLWCTGDQPAEFKNLVVRASK